MQGHGNGAHGHVMQGIRGMPYNRCRNGEGNQQKRADYFFIRERIDEYGNRQGGEGKRSLCAAYRIPHPVIPTPMTL